MKSHHNSGLDSGLTHSNLTGVSGTAVSFNIIPVHPNGYSSGYGGTNKHPISSVNPNRP